MLSVFLFLLANTFCMCVYLCDSSSGPSGINFSSVEEVVLFFSFLLLFLLMISPLPTDSVLFLLLFLAIFASSGIDSVLFWLPFLLCISSSWDDSNIFLLPFLLSNSSLETDLWLEPTVCLKEPFEIGLDVEGSTNSYISE